MNTSWVDANAFYGKYIRKSDPVVSAKLARKLENERNENSTRASLVEGEIQRAHLVLDELGAPRTQPGVSHYSYSLSLEGRLRSIKGMK